jgi:eukaryotic-like serine/threonine-protein kinase
LALNLDPERTHVQEQEHSGDNVGSWVTMGERNALGCPQVPQDLEVTAFRSVFCGVMFPAEPVPEQIGAYQVQKYVGRIGAADVYVARMDGPLGFSRDVTLKLVRFSVDEDARYAEELSREAAICARLNHPVVVRMFDFFEYDRRLVLVLEQVEGASLDKLVGHLARRKQKLGDHGIFYLGTQVAAALAHAHSSMDEDGNVSPVIHRDIKPENVLVGWDGQVRLAGFGLGKILGRTPDSIAGTVRGTPGFMAPEQMRGERATVRSDVYGFGVLLWSLLTGNEPPQDGARPTPIAEARPDLPRELLAAIDAALEPSPDRRRITCADIAQWLAKLTKAEAGREELRQKVLWLRATRGPASKLDTSAKPQRAPKRRQAMQATRSSSVIRRVGGPPSSRAPSSSRFPKVQSARPEPGRTSTSNAPTSPPHASPSARPEKSPSSIPRPPSLPAAARANTFTAREDTVVLRLPPPPPLPGEGPPPTPGRARSQTPRGPSAGPPASGSNGAGPITMRPATVRTVSAAPSARSVPPARPVVPTEDMLALSAHAYQQQGEWMNGYGHHEHAEGDRPNAPFAPTFGEHPLHQGRNTETTSTFDSPHMETTRPQKPEPPTFALTTQLMLAGLTASLVVALGLLFTQRQQPAQQQPPQVVTVELTREHEPRQEAPREAARNDPPAKAPTNEPGLGNPGLGNAPSMPDPSMLADTMGYLLVKGPTPTDVYLNGVRRGATNEALMVPCGHFFLRLAPPNSGRYPAWTTRGEHAFVACKSSTVLTSRPPDPQPVHASHRRGSVL